MAQDWVKYRHLLISHVLGLTLIAAALLKFYAQLTTPSGTGAGLLLEAAWLVSSVSVCEMVVGVWLLSGAYPRWSRRVAIASFLVFLGVSLNKLLAGEQTCSCFGPLPVSPWLALGLDCLAVMCLLLNRIPSQGPLEVRPECRTPLRIALALVELSVLVGGIGLLVHGRPNSGGAGTGEPLNTGELVVLEPQGWHGKVLPILERIDIGSQLKTGDWVLVFYRRGCEACRSELPALLGEFTKDGKTIGGCCVAAVEIPSEVEDDPLSYVPPSAVKSRGALTPGPRWVVRTPLFVQLSDGVVVEAAHSRSAATKMLARWQGLYSHE